MKYAKKLNTELNVQVTTPSITKSEIEGLPFKLNFKVYDFYNSKQTIDYKIGVVESMSEISNIIDKMNADKTINYMDNISQSLHHENNIKGFIEHIKIDDFIYHQFTSFSDITFKQFEQLIISANIKIYNNIILKDIIRVDSVICPVFLQVRRFIERNSNNILLSRYDENTVGINSKLYKIKLTYDPFHYFRDFIAFFIESMIDGIAKEIDSQILFNINQIADRTESETIEVDTKNNNVYEVYNGIERLQTQIYDFCEIQAKTIIMTTKVYDFLRNTENGIFNKDDTPDSTTFSVHQIKYVGKTIFNDNVYVVSENINDFIIVSVNKYNRCEDASHYPVIINIFQLFIPIVRINRENFETEYRGSCQTNINNDLYSGKHLIKKINVKFN
jgi:hypothetical protein